MATAKQLASPWADLLPPLSTAEFEALKADIKANGVQQPILVDEDGNILDGHHRYKCDKNAPQRVIKGLSDDEKQAFVIRCNLHRRNLSPDQKTEVGKTQWSIAKRLRESDPKRWTQKAVATVLGVAQNTVSVWFSDAASNIKADISCDARIKIPTAAKPLIAARIEAGESQAQVAADFGVTRQAVGKIVKQVEKKKASEAKKSHKVKDAAGKYDLILCDPPWRYEFAETSSREIENHYPTMTQEEICALHAPAASDCILLLWATAPKLVEAMEVVSAWGFTYKTHAVWDKESIGMGYWFRGQHELLLVGTRGKVSPPEQKQRLSSVFREKRGKHSEKPASVYKWIELAFPEHTKCEMFARQRRDGWYGWGNEV